MKFDHDFARKLLLRIEEGFTEPGHRLKAIAGTEYQEYYTLKKLTEAGFLRSSVAETQNPERSFIILIEMTYLGHEFLDKVRDDKVWSQTKDQAKNFGSFSLEFLGEVAKGIVKTQIRKHSGIELD